MTVTDPVPVVSFGLAYLDCNKTAAAVNDDDHAAEVAIVTVLQVWFSSEISEN